MAPSTTYEKLAREDSEDEEQLYSNPHPTSTRSSWKVVLIFVVLIVSNASTWLVARGVAGPRIVQTDRTLYGMVLQS
jgi:hypothetical protein